MGIFLATVPAVLRRHGSHSWIPIHVIPNYTNQKIWYAAQR